MKTTQTCVDSKPSVHLTIDKSRLKIYNKHQKIPTYYLNKGDQFELEILNPTSNNVLAKIYLNNQSISQGGFALRPGEKAYLERYIDIAKRFVFDTYEVSDNEQIKKAIKSNGDIKVEFYNENIPMNGYNGINYVPLPYYVPYYVPKYVPFIQNDYYYTNSPLYGNACGMSTSYNGGSCTTTASGNGIYTYYGASNNVGGSNICNNLSKKSIETGRIEHGEDSNQNLVNVDKSFSSYAFHTIEYKILPASQKINTIDDINIRKYCSNCRSKLKKSAKFCSHCGYKA